jgi:hypothetical protein
LNGATSRPLASSSLEVTVSPSATPWPCSAASVASRASLNRCWPATRTLGVSAAASQTCHSRPSSPSSSTCPARSRVVRIGRSLISVGLTTGNSSTSDHFLYQQSRQSPSL